MKTLVLGLGNPILSDDGVGIRVAEELEGKVNPQEVTVMEAGVAGLDLLNLLSGYDRAIIIDAIQTVAGRAGDIYQLELGDLDFTRHAASPHDVNLATALELGKRLGLPLPRQIVIFAIEVADASTFSEKCTSEVRGTIPDCVEMIIRELNGAPAVQLVDGWMHSVIGLPGKSRGARVIYIKDIGVRTGDDAIEMVYLTHKLAQPAIS